MSFINQIEPEQADGLLADIYQAADHRAGYVANIIRVMSLDPEACRASMNFYTKLMLVPHDLLREDRELLATVVSSANDCYY